MVGQDFIENYKIENHIGNGGFSDVWLAIDTNTGKHCALKVIEKKIAANTKFRERFRRSVDIIKNLKHQHIVEIFALIDTPNDLALVMEYIEGINLDEFILKNHDSANPLKLLPFFIQILDALEFAHQNKIIHRDIKPSNILIDKKTYSIKLIDFDALKDVSVDSNFTSTNFTIGTYSYISPEQLLSAKNVDAQTDIYSLGLVLFYMLYGKPYLDKNKRQNMSDIANIIQNEPLPKLIGLNSNIPPVFDAILAKATEKQPENRFATCEEFKQHLLNQQNPYQNTARQAGVEMDKTQMNFTTPLPQNRPSTPPPPNPHSNRPPNYDPDRTGVNPAPNINQADKTQYFEGERTVILEKPAVEDRTHYFEPDTTRHYSENTNEQTEIFNIPRNDTNNQPININNQPNPNNQNIQRPIPPRQPQSKSSLKALDIIILVIGLIVFLIGMAFLYLKTTNKL